MAGSVSSRVIITREGKRAVEILRCDSLPLPPKLRKQGTTLHKALTKDNSQLLNKMAQDLFTSLIINKTYLLCFTNYN